MTGARGTGKSSLVKAMLAAYADRGLRLIEVDKSDLGDLADIVELVAGRPERYIVFCDDLSFEEGEAGYKALKSVLDGSVAAPGDNVLIYATSNRRHLMPEYMSENLRAKHQPDGEIHPGETVEEKISLSERFGLWLSFYPFKQDDYLDIVYHWLRELGCRNSTSSLAHRGPCNGRWSAARARDASPTIRPRLGCPSCLKNRRCRRRPDPAPGRQLLLGQRRRQALVGLVGTARRQAGARRDRAAGAARTARRNRHPRHAIAPWVTYVHVYPHTTVRLAFCHVTGWEGEPRGLENQRLEWVDPARAAEVGDLCPPRCRRCAGCSCRPATASAPSARARPAGFPGPAGRGAGAWREAGAAARAAMA